MSFITWNGELSVGIDSIDEQHKILINIINSLHEALQSGHAQNDLESRFDYLKVYILKHFAYEETLFDQYGYIESEKHKADHEILINQLNEIHQKMNEGNIMAALELADFLKGLFTEHLLKADMAYAKDLISKGAK